MKKFVTNPELFTKSPLHQDLLSLIEASYTAIDTESQLHSKIEFDGNILTIGDASYTLSNYERVYVIGFGKASSKAGQVLESILGDALTGGIIVDKDPLVCKRVEVFQGAHPQPTEKNVEASERIAELAQSLTEKDLALVIVSGGGSSLLCWPFSEYDQGARLYEAFLSVGGTVTELNTIRKHLSGLKGGGLAKLLYPATVASLIFCDVPGEHYDVVASGPTYYDHTTVKDVQGLLEKYSIENNFEFTETPKEEKYFEKVTNIPIVSNMHALQAIESTARSLGYEPISLGGEVYDTPEALVQKILTVIKPHSVVYGGGEPRMSIPQGMGGVGGRNEYISTLMAQHLPPKSIFTSFASDGIDNCSVAAGGVIDDRVKNLVQEKGLDVQNAIELYDHDTFLKTVDAQLITGVTGSNVSDIFICITR